MKAKLTFLGTGTSQGIPIIGCRCRVCQSADIRDKRFRAAALVEYGGLTMLIDAGPDFRMQMLAHRVSHLDAIILTHNHKDHTGGLDDVRSFNYIDHKAVDIYCEERVENTIRREYAYAFAEEKYPGCPEWRIHRIDDSPFDVKPNTGYKLDWVENVGYKYTPVEGEAPKPAVRVIPIRGWHAQMPVLGFRFGDIAYITDMSMLPEEEFAKLQGLKHLTLNTVGFKHHHSHFSLQEALDLAARIGAEHTWLTHLSHSVPPHAEFEEMLREKTGGAVLPAYDGLIIED
ncbi:MAG: MBL fold metallo-hydrolase [Bacteroidales bacterium]|nr:MBL fold metallo-hydrolase [Bacteroidales bacterium]